jgi:hypothetical protein
MSLEFGGAVKVLDEYIGILKQNLLFLTSEGKPENIANIITTKQQLDEAIRERMRLSQIYSRSTDSMLVSPAVRG